MREALTQKVIQPVDSQVFPVRQWIGVAANLRQSACGIGTRLPPTLADAGAPQRALVRTAERAAGRARTLVTARRLLGGMDVATQADGAMARSLR